MNRYDELSTKEQEIIEDIKNAPVPAISQDEINVACRVASSYYAKKQSFWKVTFSCFLTDLGFIWILLAFLIGSCVMLMVGCKLNSAAFLIAFAPVPVIVFAIRELQYRDNNLSQIEKTCKYAPEKIYFARLWVSMLFNAIFVLIMGGTAFSKSFLSLYFCSFIAMFFVGALAFLIMSLSDNSLPLSVIMAAWILGAVYFLSSDELASLIVSLNLWILVSILIFSVGLFVAATVKTTRRLYD